jgi:hypothetical protein
VKKFGRGGVDPKGNIFTRLEARVLDRRAAKIERGLGGWKIARGES